VIHIFLTWAAVGAEWSTSFPCRIFPGEKVPVIRYIWGWVGPTLGLDDEKKRKFLTLPGLELQTLGNKARSNLLDVIFCNG
jgi:hypothetical protein